MKDINKSTGLAIIQKTAKSHNLSFDEMYAELRSMIDEIWDNPDGQEQRQKLFPNGKPTPESFITVVSSYISDNESKFG